MGHQHEHFAPEDPQRHAERPQQGMSLHQEYLHEITGRILGNVGSEKHQSGHHAQNGSLDIPPIHSVIGEHGQHHKQHGAHLHQHHEHNHEHHHQQNHSRHIGGGGAKELPPVITPPSDTQPVVPPSDIPPWQQQPYPVIPPFDGGSGNGQPAQPGDNGSADTPNPPANPGDNTNPGASAKPVDHGDPNSFFICQFADKRFNPNGPSSSEDCGPTSLAMIAKAYGASFTDPVDHKQIDAANGDPEALVMGVRGLMTGKHGHDTGTDVTQVEKAAKKMGFDTAAVSGLNDLDSQLSQGHMVVLSGNPKDYEKDLGLHYGKGGKIYDGGHFITVVGKDGDKYIVNDPATHGGSMELTREQMDKYIKNQGASGEIGVAVYK